MSEHNYCVEVGWTGDQTCSGPAGAAALKATAAEGFLKYAKARGNVLLEYVAHAVELGDFGWCV